MDAIAKLKELVECDVARDGEAMGYSTRGTGEPVTYGDLRAWHARIQELEAKCFDLEAQRDDLKSAVKDWTRNHDAEFRRAKGLEAELDQLRADIARAAQTAAGEPAVGSRQVTVRYNCGTKFTCAVVDLDRVLSVVEARNG